MLRELVEGPAAGVGAVADRVVQSGFGGGAELDRGGAEGRAEGVGTAAVVLSEPAVCRPFAVHSTLRCTRADRMSVPGSSGIQTVRTR